MSEAEKVNVTINGTTVATDQGRMLIDIAEEIGIFIPRFCYHPGMKSVAVCRMCLVQVEGQRKLLPACATPVTPDMVVNTVSEEAVDAQEGMLEFLLINHPLDCPICDRGGECPLQDQTYRHGPGSSRYIEPKRTYEKALEISDLVVLDRERCVLCWRCVRFCDEISGDQFIQLVDRGAGTQILTFNDEPFDSYFSGNTIQICPVGALTSKPYRFVSRPWDLETAPSVCSYCAVGCPITNEARDKKLVRCQALPNEQVNDFWICDKGRFGYHYVSNDERLTNPLIRGAGDSFEVASWGQAIERVALALDAKRVGVIAGGHLTTEDSFAIGRLAREVLGTNDVDSRIQDAGAPYEVFAETIGVAGSTARLMDLEDAKSIIWIGPDPKETLPVLYLRLRNAVLEKGATLTVVGPRRTSLDSIATKVVRDRLDVTISKDEPTVVCWGPSSAGRNERAQAEAVAGLVGQGAKLLMCVPHAGSQGALDMGLHPALGPGAAPLETAGRDTRAMLEAAAAGELDTLLIFGADLISDFPDADLVRRALSSNVFVAVAELFPTETVSYGDVVFPSAAYAEREGTLTNLERRIQKLERLLQPPGTAREIWDICATIASARGADWGWTNFDDIWTDIKKSVPTHADVDIDALKQQRVLPPREQDQSGYVGESVGSSIAMGGPGGQYPKGYRQGAPFQTGQNWPLSWELRAFEANQRPGVIPPIEPQAGEIAEGRAPQKPTEEAAEAVGPPKPAASEGTFVLLSGRQIYDEGAMVSKSVALRNLQKKPFVEMNDEDVKELGLADGDEVVIEGAGTKATLPLVVADVARGAVFVPYDQTGLRANTLMSEIDPRVTVSPA